MSDVVFAGPVDKPNRSAITATLDGPERLVPAHQVLWVSLLMVAVTVATLALG